METPKTLQQAIQFFTDYDNCRKFLASVRWLDGVVRCPHCGADKVTYLEKARVYRCYGKHAKQKFSLKAGTVFEDSPIGLEKWLPAVWLIVNNKNGISSYELHRALGVTQKSAWFMLHRIRLAMQSKSFNKLGGPGSEVEVDEAFIGGKAKNMHKSRKVRLQKARSEMVNRTSYERYIGKTAIIGMLDREQRKVRATVIPNTRRDTLQSEILNSITEGSKVYTDQAVAYDKLAERYTHEFVNHLDGYVRGRVSTNGLRELLELAQARIEWYLYRSRAFSFVPLFG
jgi:transposase-like protein